MNGTSDIGFAAWMADGSRVGVAVSYDVGRPRIPAPISIRPEAET